jgi:hypothetical protein
MVVAGAARLRRRNIKNIHWVDLAIGGGVNGKEEEEELNRLPWLGQSGRAAAGCACTAAALRC